MVGDTDSVVKRAIQKFHSSRPAVGYHSEPLVSSSQLHCLHFAVALLVGELCYMPESHRLDSWWCHWNFSLTYSFWSDCGCGIDSASNRNECQEYFLGGKGGRCVGLATLPPSCSWNLEASTSWKPRGMYSDCCTFACATFTPVVFHSGLPIFLSKYRNETYRHTLVSR